MVFIAGHPRGTAAVLVGRGGAVGSEAKWEEAEHTGTLVLEGVYSGMVGRDGKQGVTGVNLVLKMAHGEYTGARQNNRDMKMRS